MDEARGGLTRRLGILALFLTVLWCAVGGGIYGPAILCFHGRDLTYLILVLLFGPLSILPAGVVAHRKERIAGFLLLSSSLLTSLLLLGWFCAERGNLSQILFSFPAFGLTLLLCAPQFLLGLGFLWWERKIPQVRLGLAIVAGLYAAALTGLIATRVGVAPEWTLTLGMDDGKRCVHFDPRKGAEKVREIDAAFDTFFQKTFPSGSKERVNFTLEGRKSSGSPVSLSYSVDAERTSDGRLLFNVNGMVLGRNLGDTRAILETRRYVVEGIVTQSLRAWESAPQR